MTAPAGFVPSVMIRKGGEETIYSLSADDAFLKSIQHFSDCIVNERTRQERYNTILKQAKLIDEFEKLAGWDNI